MTESSPLAAIETDVLIVGAGPAGASLACFLAYNGVKGFLISRDKSTALQPRAHYTNPGAWECLRDIGLEHEWRQVAVNKSHYGDYRFCNTLAGPDFLRNYSFTNHPAHLGAYREVSPCEHGDVGQNVGEPLLIKYATQHGFDTRFSSKFLSYSRDDSTGLFTSTIEDQITGARFQVVSKYVCGADGTHSAVAAQAGLPYHVSPVSGVALNVWYEADLSHLYAASPGMMHYISTPDVEPPQWAIRGMNRLVRPYKEFVMAMIPSPGVSSIDVTNEQVLARLKELIGDPNVKINLKGVYRWRVNEAYAEVISKDNNIFCLGDAIHRHPPGNGLGSNTCIQDAYNLAWKLAYVLQGKASPNLLASYNAERQPVAKRIVRVANDALRHYAALDAAMGFTEPTNAARAEFTAVLSSPTPAGRALRATFKQARETALDDLIGLGAEMNQSYASAAVHLDDETGPPPFTDLTDSASVRHHVISTYPGSRLPHAWLGTHTFGEKLSTQDLAGHGQFTLLTGIGGKEVWTRAALKATEALRGRLPLLGDDGNGNNDKGDVSTAAAAAAAAAADTAVVTINVHAIGFGQEYTDLYGAWEERRGVDDDGAVLVRPDRTVAWRCMGLQSDNEDGNEDLYGDKLLTVMKKILGWE